MRATSDRVGSGRRGCPTRRGVCRKRGDLERPSLGGVDPIERIECRDEFGGHHANSEGNPG